MSQQMLSRRQFLTGLSVAMGVALTPMGAKAAQAALSDKKFTSPLVLSGEQLKLIELVAEIIIPVTDTPGASAAGVHHFINKVVSYFLSTKERDEFIQGLDSVKPLLTQSSKQQQLFVEQLDKKRKPEDFFTSLKQMVVFGYYTSEVGATQELRFDPVPGPYKEMPFKDIGRVWA